MRTDHLDAFRPVCPLCRAERAEERTLTLATIALRGAAGVVVEGMLHCPNPLCRREFPIIDGVPVIVGPLRTYLQEAQAFVTARDELSAEVESALGDCLGPGSAFDVARSQPGSYAWDHWADLDPAEPKVAEGGFPRPGAALRLLARGLALADGGAGVGAGASAGGSGGTSTSTSTSEPPPTSRAALALDVGSSTGRVTFALAERTGGLALGVDMHMGMLRLAQRVLLRGEVSYARRRTGVAFDRRRFAVALEAAPRVDFWACDAMALPLPRGSIGLAAALNVLDCVRSPRDLLASLGRVLAPGAALVLATPYDWSTSATPIEGWIGGHSQRGPGSGAPEPVLRALLDPSGPDGFRVPGLALAAEDTDVPWHVRLHDRAAVLYRAHLAVVRGTG